MDAVLKLFSLHFESVRIAEKIFKSYSFVFQQTKLIRAIRTRMNFNVIKAIVSAIVCCAMVRYERKIHLQFFVVVLGVPHCLDGSDEIEDRYCQVKPDDSLEHQRSEFNRRAQLKRYQHWRGIVIVAFLLIIFMAFSIFMVYLLCQRCCQTSDYLINEQKKPVSTIVTSSEKKKKFNFVFSHFIFI